MGGKGCGQRDRESESGEAFQTELAYRNRWNSANKGVSGSLYEFLDYRPEGQKIFWGTYVFKLETACRIFGRYLICIDCVYDGM